MQKNSNLNHLFIFFFLAIAAIVTSIRFIDRIVAIKIWAFTSSYPFLHKHFENIPDTLLKVVVTGTTILWLTYYFITRKKVLNRQACFLKLAATALPLAFLAKSFLQFAFGRTLLRFWLHTGGAIEFNLFKATESNGGFPSGHMAVFTAFFAAVWLYYPGCRSLVVAMLSALAAALLFTSYHFVSDILAGILCGILITVCLHHFFNNRGPGR